MGIESDQVVYEYLSRVGDVAQQQQLPSATRMRLVAHLRDEIDARRAKTPVDSPAAVRRILTRLGTPDEVVARAGGTPVAPDTPTAAVPVQRESQDNRRGRDHRRGRDPGQDRDGGEDRTDLKAAARKRLRRVIPKPRPAEAAPPPAPFEGPSSPHFAPTHELGDPSAQPDWWRTDNTPFGPGDQVPGFVGGVEIPELLKPPPKKRDDGDDGGDGDGDHEGTEGAEGDGDDAAGAEPGVETEGEGSASRRRLHLPAAREWNNPLLLLAAALLVTGAVLGNLLPLALGWLIAWASRRLTRAEMKTAVIGLPALAVAAAVVWLWGRTDGRWGEPIPEGTMDDVLNDTWPWVLRGAAVASAAFLVWRSQRPR
ncbi:hypothetical protein ACIQNG_14730 [Streptomyces sp. NPDC091377]|uniref:hypothetical protein n=1 Tax=Streptomyces sp. NPDC091377 TaxID=3365995 RepID=UPI0038049976